ncbi:hypothetical protein Hanom_Chr05g00388631 [Helianthus anomalus]
MLDSCRVFGSCQKFTPLILGLVFQRITKGTGHPVHRPAPLVVITSHECSREMCWDKIQSTAFYIEIHDLYTINIHIIYCT